MARESVDLGGAELVAIREIGGQQAPGDGAIDLDRDVDRRP